jgi:hypothetical protein
MNRFPSKLRVIAVVLATATLAAFGCSLVVEFDESQIPTTDTGVAVTDSAGGETLPDTGTPPVDTGLDDTGAVSEAGSDTGLVTETSTMMETSVTDTGTTLMDAIPEILPDTAISLDADDAD